jgi:protocatechuate 3,4-dioxygenase alpha subunit
MKPVTPSQTIGPFWHPLADPALADLTRLGAPGPRIVLTGHVVDGDGAPISDACVELWQATPAASASFPGWGRCATGPHGAYTLTTVRPDPAAPYAAIAVLARGLVKPLWTRVYFADSGDALLASLAPARRATLLARADGDVWRWDIRLQGEPETVFFDL